MRTPLNFLTDHPASVGESYFGHMRSASGFGIRMIGGGIACLLHGFFPFVFEKTGSGQITLLYDRMVTHRNKAKATVTDEANSLRT
jgi:hypothetical protein